MFEKEPKMPAGTLGTGSGIMGHVFAMGKIFDVIKEAMAFELRIAKKTISEEEANKRRLKYYYRILRAWANTGGHNIQERESMEELLRVLKPKG
jgi:hypothetical protein